MVDNLLYLEQYYYHIDKRSNILRESGKIERIEEYEPKILN